MKDPRITEKTAAEQLGLDARTATTREINRAARTLARNKEIRRTEADRLSQRARQPVQRLCSDLLNYYWFPQEEETPEDREPVDLAREAREILSGLDISLPSALPPTDLDREDHSMDHAPLQPVPDRKVDRLRTTDPLDLLPAPDFRL